MKLRTPELSESEYEVRIWNKQGLMYGDAQMLYILSKTKQEFEASKYIIYWDGPVLSRITKHKPVVPTTDSLWNQLLKENILTLPNEVAIYNQLRPPQPKNSSWITTEKDGSVNVHAKKRENGVYITDGEDYYVEVFGHNSYRQYAYSNPKGYIRYKPKILELRQFVTILEKIDAIFQSRN